MARQIINTGNIPNDKTGDSLRTAMIKVNSNFEELYNTAVVATSLVVGNNSSVANTTMMPGRVSIGNSTVNSVVNSTTVSTTVVYTGELYNTPSYNISIATREATDIIFSTNGTSNANERMKISANGNVGVGNSTPSEKLRVEGAFGANTVVVGNSTSFTTINSIFFAATANNTDFVGVTPKDSVVNSVTLSANLNHYVTNTSLSSKVSILRANVASYIDASFGLVSNSSGVFVAANTGLVANSTGLHVNPSILNVNSAVYVPANNGIISNSSGVFVAAGNGTVVNSSGVHVNTSFIGRLTANNVTFVDVTPANSVVNTITLSANLARYVETSELSANILTLTSNNSLYAYGKSELELTVNNAVNIIGNGSVNTISVSANTGRFTNVYSNTIYLDAGFGSQAPIYGVRAWGSFDGRVGNVVWLWRWWYWPVLIELGTGQYEIVFNTPMPDTNYAVIASADVDRVTWPWSLYPGPGIVDVFDRTTTSVKVRLVGGWWFNALQYYDSARVSIAIIR